MAEEKKGFFRRLADGLAKTRNNIVSGMDAIFNGFSDIDDDFYDEIEETLVMGDIGINATTAIIDNLKQKVKEQHIKDPHECKELLINSIKEQMQVGETAYEFEHRTSVVLVIGVNGVGPKGALGILSGISADELRFAVLSDDVKTISKAPGIGKKTAQKMILELKDKLKLEDAFEMKLAHQQEEAAEGASDLRDSRQEAVEALVALGYSSADALRAVRKVPEDVPADDVEAILRAALKNF